MKITIENTDRIVQLNNVPARIWEGETETGIKVIVFITRIAVADKDNPIVQQQFQKELQETKAPTAEALSFPLKMIL